MLDDHHQDSNSVSSLSNNVNIVRRQDSRTTIDFLNFGTCHASLKSKLQPASLDSLKSTRGNEVNITLALGNNNCFSSDDFDVVARRRRTSSDALCKLLQDKVPWQSKIIPCVAEALVESEPKDINWLLFQGNDSTGKRRLALAVAESFLGSADLLLHLNMMMSTDKDIRTPPFSQVLAGALRTQESLVVLVEDVDFADTHFLKFLADGYETGEFGGEGGNGGGRRVFILTKDDRKTVNSVIRMSLKVKTQTTTTRAMSSIDHHKWKADDDDDDDEWDIWSKTSKIPRLTDQTINTSASNYTSAVGKNGSYKKEDLPNIRPSDLDLNEDVESQDNEKWAESPLSSSSDLTTSAERSAGGLIFIDMIKKRFVLDREEEEEEEEETRKVKGQEVLSRMQSCLGNGDGGSASVVMSFGIEDRVLEELVASGSSSPTPRRRWWTLRQ